MSAIWRGLSLNLIYWPAVAFGTLLAVAFAFILQNDEASAVTYTVTPPRELNHHDGDIEPLCSEAKAVPEVRIAVALPLASLSNTL